MNNIDTNAADISEKRQTGARPQSVFNAPDVPVCIAMFDQAAGLAAMTSPSE